MSSGNGKSCGICAGGNSWHEGHGLAYEDKIKQLEHGREANQHKAASPVFIKLWFLPTERGKMSAARLADGFSDFGSNHTAVSLFARARSHRHVLSAR